MSTIETPTRASTPTTAPGGRAALSALATGAVVALVAVLVVFPGGSEARVTGSALLGLACTWAMVARRRRWAAVPAAAFGATGAALVLLDPGAGAMDTLAWIWPLPVAALAVWTWRRLRELPRRARLVLAPVLVALVAASAGTLAQDLRSTPDAPGTTYVVDGSALHLDCHGPVGSGPTVVLLNGLGGSSAHWERVVRGVSAEGTRVCAYDRAGQGWSDPAARPQDAVAATADLHAVLEQAGIGRVVLAGHSVGGAYALSYVHAHPDQVAGLVLLDSSSPEQATRIDGFTTELAITRRLVALAPSLSRLGIGHLVPGGPLPPRAAALAATPAAYRNLRDEQSVILTVFGQARAVRTLGDLPLAVLTASENAADPDWADAQDALAALSGDAVHRTVTSSHEGLLLDPGPARASVAAIAGVVARTR